MIKELLLIGALGFAPITTNEVEGTEETPTTYILNENVISNGSISLNVYRINEDTKTLLSGDYANGDIVEITTKAEVFYKVESVDVKYLDTSLGISHTDDTSLYSFTLLDSGVYDITVKFNIDTETFSQFAKIYDEVRNGDWKSVFSVENITFVGMTLVYAIYFISRILSDRKFRANVVSDVCERFGLSRDTTPSALVNDMTEKYVIPAIKELEDYELKLNSNVETLLQAVLYLAEGGNDSKEKIVKLIGSMEFKNESVNTIVEEVLKKLADSKAVEEAKKEAINTEIKALKEETATSINENTKVVEDNIAVD